jgi:hypothetical protein
MKLLITAGWILLAVEVVAILALLVVKDMGNDAAGQGVALGYGLVLTPFVLAAAGALVWGTRGGPRAVLWAGLVIAFLPVLVGAGLFASNAAGRVADARARAEVGRFADARLTTLARAITAKDGDAMRSLLAQGRVDWTARDAVGRTLLGHAIAAAIEDFEDFQGTSRVPMVRQLLDAGAPVTRDLLAPAASPEAKRAGNLVYHLFSVHNPSALEILDLVLSRGLSPDEDDEDARPLYFSTFTVLPSLVVLQKHGADFTRLDPRADRAGQNALQNAVRLQLWDVAQFFLECGLDPDATAADGTSARALLEAGAADHGRYVGEERARFEAFRAALAARDAGATRVTR